MSLIIGIDVGGSTTKIVGFRVEGDKRTLIEPQFVKANDPVTATYGAFGKFTDENNISIKDIDRVMMTGVGASFVKHNLYGLECIRVPEFNGIGKGGIYLSGLDEALVVSMGTGTAMVHASSDGSVNYIGGTGVGGGSLMGLSKLMLKAESISHIEEYALGGDLANVDLRIKDISKGDGGLFPDLTASNFGNVSDIATKDDIALGILNMVYETIGMMSIFAARSVNVENIVMTGNLTRLGYCNKKCNFFNSMKATYGVNFIIPKLAEYSTVIGTALLGF